MASARCRVGTLGGATASGAGALGSRVDWRARPPVEPAGVRARAPVGPPAWRRGGLLTDSGRERHDLRVGWRLELLLQQHFVDPGVVQRGRAIACGDQGLHQPDRDPGVERVLRRELPPPLGRLGAVAALPGPLRQALEGGGVVPREPRPLLFQPALELGRVGDVKPVEKGADVLGCGPLQAARLDGEREGGDIAGDEVGIEADVAGPEENLVRADLLPQGVQGLVEPLRARSSSLSGQSMPSIWSRVMPCSPAEASRASNASRRGWEAAPLRRCPSRSRNNLPNVLRRNRLSSVISG